MNPFKDKAKYFLEKPILMYIFVYLLINILFLDNFPFIHSDESWLSGLSRNYLESGSPAVTETFFNTYRRFPHGIKIIFHYIQAAFILLMGYSPFTVRLVSLLASCGILYVFYLVNFRKTRDLSFALISTVVLSLDIQYIYASHFARQEILILFLMITSYYIYYRNISSMLKPVLLALLTGLAIGFHPNALFISAITGLLYLYDIFIVKREKISSLAIYVLITGIIAFIFVAISFSFDSNFIYHYMKIGDQFGVLETPSTKLSTLKYFYMKLYYSVSGTYYTPYIKFQFWLFIFSIASALYCIIKNREEHYLAGLLLCIAGINITYVVIGRFNQTSFVFQVPFMWLIYLNLVNRTNIKRIITFATCTLLFYFSIFNIYPYLNNDYEDYIENIAEIVSAEDKVLCNLNAEFYFGNGSLLDYRNLHYLKDNDLNFEEYINSNDIEYIIYPEEMDFIYDHRPVWNGIYGNLYYYYDDMNEFFEENCTLEKEFTSPYGMRIVRYMYRDEWSVKIYKVN
ncbi:Dolichyl-phosphate-mannose-protein mannosyltransferase [Dethiosulfatibacter aminovorans DSM 17477]|uniref:Dolichyl-phosphate-mannose-protein mannosyltransferase n=1 Tax=Dethiosulfatibacter aminovorans DSM 17477 TaxID=1121476 RepID=A0A1M6K4B6_9FIRM|nr:phospholipid carrier-dependent glycosyltransferase [Dethiosulfatibacter aminovorans]SHJ53777.1 Dolichyl-phosphate-mannose-protein mannosyltransferase [Dethiosulfatibacter aminovorans DSM 17477]